MKTLKTVIIATIIACTSLITSAALAADSKTALVHWKIERDQVVQYEGDMLVPLQGINIYDKMTKIPYTDIVYTADGKLSKVERFAQEGVRLNIMADPTRRGDEENIDFWVSGESDKIIGWIENKVSQYDVISRPVVDHLTIGAQFYLSVGQQDKWLMAEKPVRTISLRLVKIQ